jgi:hypothetical protein
MTRKAATILGIFFIGILLTACSNGDNGSGDATGFIGGTQGVQLSFGNNAPPNPIADGGQQTFPVIVQAENLGEQQVEASNATIKLEGFSYSAFNKTRESLTSQPPEDIQANRQTPDGEEIDAAPVFTEFPGFSYVDNVQAGYETAMIAKMCYEYGSTTSTELCIRDDMLLADSSSPCQVSSTRDSSSSGAPVQITKVEQEVSTSDRTLVTFTVKNQGSGDVYRSGTTCDPEQGQRVEGDVIVSFSDLNGVTELDCRGHRRLGERTFRLRMSQQDLQQGETFTCDMTIPAENRNNREEPFTADLSYLYETSTSKTLTVRNSVQ